MHLPHVAAHYAYFNSPRPNASEPHPLAQSLQRNQLELSDAIALSVDQGMQLAALYLELGPRVVVGRFAKPRELFKPVH